MKTHLVLALVLALSATASAANVIYSQEVGVTTSEFQDADVFFVSLDTAPTASVTIPLSSTDTTEGTVVPSVTFTTANWATPQGVYVTGKDDLLHDGDITFTVVLGAATSADPAYDGLDPADVQVVNLDNDRLTVEVYASGKQQTTEAGGTYTFKMRLPQAPTANVTCPVWSSDTTEGTLAVSSVVFTPTNWGYQNVVVTGVDDAIVDGLINYFIMTDPCTSTDLAYDGSNPTTVGVSNKDND